MLLLYNNHADNGIYSGGSWALPLTNIQDPRPSKKARSSSASSTETKFRVTLASSAALAGVAITHTNLSAAAQYRITWYSDAFITEVGNSGWLDVPGYPDYDPDFLGASIFHVFDTPVTATYWQIEFDDGANSDGYVEIGRVFLSDYWTPTNNFGTSNSDIMEANTPRQNSLGGTGYFNRRTPVRTFAATLERVTESEIPTVRRIRRICNVNRQLVFIPDTEDEDNFHERCFVATFAQMPSISLLDGSEVDASVTFELTEVVG